MSEEMEIKNCNDDDILSFYDEICKIKKIRKVTQEYFYSESTEYINHICTELNIRELEISKPAIIHGKNYKYTTNSEWFKTGKECELLQEGKRWQKGKLRIKLTLEFCPDEPEKVEENDNQEFDNITESPLDEIRQQLTDEN
jgi:hypothetical protein